jgi:hypothetical protein
VRIRLALILSQILLFTAGTALLLAAVFAVPLGLDNDAGWGTGRILMAAGGAVLLLTGALLHFHRRTFPLIARAIRGLEKPAARGEALSPARTAWFAFSGAVLSILIFTFYISAGTFTRWPASTTYFDRLADAFLAGQVALLEQPGPDLTALDNPYDYHNREGVNYLWDATYYQGKYYLYWGPVPGMLAAAAKWVVPGVVEDQALVWFFVSGSIIVLALILRHLHYRLFPRAPAWTLAALVCLGGLAAPVLWLASRPSVYEVAIAGGQFFLLLGLYGALRSGCTLPEPAQPKAVWLLLTGFGWGAAVACRLTLAPAVLVLALFLVIPILRETRPWGARLRKMLWLGLAPALFAAGLGWYNYARFGSLLETGHRYQLTGPALPGDYSLVTSTAYILPSLYSYLARPLTFTAEFPFVGAPFLTEQMWPFFIRLPQHYYFSEPVAGLLMVLPAAALALLPVLGVLHRFGCWLNHRSLRLEAHDREFKWIWWLAAAGTLALLGPLLLFISTSMRYLADVTWLAVLLTALGWWWALRRLRDYPLPRGLTLWLGIILIAISITLSLLINLDAPEARLQLNNPALYNTLRLWFE